MNHSFPILADKGKKVKKLLLKYAAHASVMLRKMERSATLFKNLLCQDVTPRTHRRNKKARPHRT